MSGYGIFSIISQAFARENLGKYALVNLHITMERSTIFDG
jgi:hypothetical protein